MLGAAYEVDCKLKISKLFGKNKLKNSDKQNTQMNAGGRSNTMASQA